MFGPQPVYDANKSLTGGSSSSSVVSPSPLRTSTSSSSIARKSTHRPRRGSVGEKKARRERSYSTSRIKRDGGSTMAVDEDSDDGLTMAETPDLRKRDSREGLTHQQDHESGLFPDFTNFRLEDQVADILSTFNAPPAASNPSSDPSIRNDYTDPLSNMDLGLSSLLNYPDSSMNAPSPSLPATIYGLAVSNPGFFLTLRKAVPPEYCAISFFKRLENQIWTVGKRYSEFLYSSSMGSSGGYGESGFGLGFGGIGTGNGISGNPGISLGGVKGMSLAEDEEMSLPDEKWCERALKRRVDNLRRHLVIREPLGKAAREQAFKVLFRALWEVVERGGEEREIYSGEEPSPSSRRKEEGDRKRSPQESSSKRTVTQATKRIGIYGRLIGAEGVASAQPPAGLRYGGGVYLAPIAAGASAGGKALSPSVPHPPATKGSRASDFFVITAMGELIDVAGPFVDRLQKLANRIRSYGARDGYVEEFEYLLTRISGRQEGTSRDIMREALKDNSAGSRRSSSVESTKRARSASRDEQSEKLKRRCS